MLFPRTKNQIENLQSKHLKIDSNFFKVLKTKLKNLSFVELASIIIYNVIIVPDYTFFESNSTYEVVFVCFQILKISTLKGHSYVNKFFNNAIKRFFAEN